MSSIEAFFYACLYGYVSLGFGYFLRKAHDKLKGE